MLTDQECKEMLMKIFPPKPEPVQSELPQEMVKVIEIAKSLGLTWIPTIILEEEPQSEFTGRLDYNHYSETTIRIAKIFRPFNDSYYDQKRSMSKMCRTLAHELGHCYHVQTEGNKASYNWSKDGSFDEKGGNMGYCERFADNFRDKILKVVNG